MKKDLRATAKCDKIQFAGSSGSAGIGRQVRLRGVCRKAYGFKSHLPHQKRPPKRWSFPFRVEFPVEFVTLCHAAVDRGIETAVVNILKKRRILAPLM